MKVKWLLILLMCTAVRATPIRYAKTVDVWANVAQNAVREGSETNIDDWDVAWIHLSSAMTGETAHTGTMFYIQVSATATGDNNWTTYTNTLGPTGTANDVAVTADVTTSTMTVYCSDTSGKFDDDGVRWIFLHNSTAVSESAMLLATAHAANAYVTVLDAPEVQQVTHTRMFDCASSTSIQLPRSVVRIRVIHDNTYDSDGASVTTRCDITGHKN